jgi:ATP-binding cassette subfamily B protein
MIFESWFVTRHRKSRTLDIARVITGGIDRPCGLWFTITIFIVAAGALFGASAPIMLKNAVDLLASPLSVVDLDHALIRAIMAYVSMLVAQRVCDYVRLYTYARGEQRLTTRIASQIFSHMLRLPISYHRQNAAGASGQCLSEATTGVRLTVSHFVLTFTPVTIQVVTAVVVLLATFGTLIGICVAFGITLYAVIFGMGVRKLNAAMRKISTSHIQVGAYAIDRLSGIEVLKCFTGEKVASDRYVGLLNAAEGEWAALQRQRLISGISSVGVFSVLCTSVLMLAGRAVATGQVSSGSFVLIAAYLLQLTGPLEALGLAARDLGQGFGYLGKAAEVLSCEIEGCLEPYTSDAPGARCPTGGPAELKLSGVSLSIDGRAILKNVCLDIRPGAVVAIVGPSGSGKSTIARLIARLYEPTEGAMLLDGRPLRELSTDELRSNVLLVSQEPKIFMDTVEENVRFGASRAERSNIRESTRVAGLDELLNKLPDGLETIVGEQGIRLSGGETQKVGIARAFLRRPRLIIFDEATSALDPKTEKAVWAGLLGATKAVTTIIVTHRLNNVVAVDEIFVICDGRVVQRGKHDELRSLSGVYRELWSAQQEGTGNLSNG